MGNGNKIQPIHINVCLHLKYHKSSNTTESTMLGGGGRRMLFFFWCPFENVSELFFGSNLFLIIAKQIFNQETCKGILGQQFLVASNIYM